MCPYCWHSLRVVKTREISTHPQKCSRGVREWWTCKTWFWPFISDATNMLKSAIVDCLCKCPWQPHLLSFSLTHCFFLPFLIYLLQTSVVNQKLHFRNDILFEYKCLSMYFFFHKPAGNCVTKQLYTHNVFQHGDSASNHIISVIDERYMQSMMKRLEQISVALKIAGNDRHIDGWCDMVWS